MAANALINVGSFTDWAFGWGNGFSWGIGTHTFAPNVATFQLEGAGLGLANVALCFSASGVCLTGAHPVALVRLNEVFATFNAAGNQARGDGSWSGPTIINAAAEPSSLTLAGLALMGAAALRRKTH